MTDQQSTAAAPTEQPKWLPHSEFVSQGYLREVNRVFFHPLGMALAVREDAETGDVLEIAGVIDSRSDPEGFIFAEALDGPDDLLMAMHCDQLALEHEQARLKLEITGNHVVQPVFGFEPKSMLYRSLETGEAVIKAAGPVQAVPEPAAELSVSRLEEIQRRVAECNLFDPLTGIPEGMTDEEYATRRVGIRNFVEHAQDDIRYLLDLLQVSTGPTGKILIGSRLHEQDPPGKLAPGVGSHGHAINLTGRAPTRTWTNSWPPSEHEQQCVREMFASLRGNVDGLPGCVGNYPVYVSPDGQTLLPDLGLENLTPEERKITPRWDATLVAPWEQMLQYVDINGCLRYGTVTETAAKLIVTEITGITLKARNEAAGRMPPSPES